MKKRLVSIITAITALVLAIVMACGCSFIDETDSTATDSRLDSVVAAKTVNFGTTAHDVYSSDLVEAVAKVERSSVMIVIGNSSSGSGVIVDMSFDSSGENAASWKNDSNVIYIITCHHMMSQESTSGITPVGEITVYIPDENCNYENTNYIFDGYIGNEQPSVYNNGYGGKKYAVTLVGGDYESDIALLKLDLNIPAKSGNKLSADKIVKAQIPDFSTGYTTRKAETVFSIGNPTGTLPGTVASGIVSYLERKTAVSDVGVMTLMQIDVSTNPGSSGGGLYNMFGELIGITNAGNTNYTNINFAIPCYLSNGNGFVDIVAQLGGTATETNYGYVSGRKAKFGFTITQGTDDSNNSYLYISSVNTNSISYNSGLRQGDEVVSIKVGADGTTKSISQMSTFQDIMSELKAGDEVTLNVKRTKQNGWKTTTIDVAVKMITESYHFCNTGK